MNAPSGKDSAVREMLAELRLLAIKGHLPGGGERIERWEAALDAGEPGLGRLDAIRGVIAEFSGSWYELGEVRRVVEQVTLLASGSPAGSGIQPGGSAHIAATDLPSVLEALDQAAEYQRNRAGDCLDCDDDPETALCTACEARMATADQFDELYVKLGGQ